LAQWRLSPLTVRGSQSHHAGQFWETPLRQAAGTLSASSADVVVSKSKKSVNMKKLLFSTMILSIVFASCRDKDEPEPTWVLGKASFATDSTWIVSNGTITQTWSDVVQTVDCGNKTTFNGGNSTSGYNIDCRSNPSQKGDLFSWRAVAELKDELCPDDWRVPTREDFRNLDIAMGGTGELRGYADGSYEFGMEKYLNPSVWGSPRSGICNPDGSLNYQGYDIFFYWSQSESNVNRGFGLVFMTGQIHPQSDENKNQGFPLRCVR
jgi:uncharacterized protein (TIGR02145 family)